MSGRPQDDRNQEATVYLVRLKIIGLEQVLTSPQGNLDERVTDAIVWELMLQAGPVGVLRVPLLHFSLPPPSHPQLSTLPRTKSLKRVFSECPSPQRPHFDEPPGLRLLRIPDGGGCGICL